MCELICGGSFIIFLFFIVFLFSGSLRLRLAKDSDEVRRILKKELENYRKKSYKQLIKLEKLENIEYKEISGKSGREYFLEIQGVWDSGVKGGNLRVIASIHGGGISAYFPYSNDFIISPEGEFIGE